MRGTALSGTHQPVRIRAVYSGCSADPRPIRRNNVNHEMLLTPLLSPGVKKKASDWRSESSNYKSTETLIPAGESELLKVLPPESFARGPVLRKSFPLRPAQVGSIKQGYAVSKSKLLHNTKLNAHILPGSSLPE